MLSQKNINFKRGRIVRVIVTFNDVMISFGTGFFVQANGLFLTCGHVVLGSDFKNVQNKQDFINTPGVNSCEKAMNYHSAIVNNIKVELENGNLMNATLDRINPDYDVAILHVLGEDFSHSFLRVEKIVEPYLGEEISFYGFPEVLGHTYTNSPFVVNTSIVSTFPTTTIAGGNYKHMQINATTIGGISGAPVFKGDSNVVIGIINGNYHWAFNNIVCRGQNGDEVWTTRVPLGIGYATSMKIIYENTDIFKI